MSNGESKTLRNMPRVLDILVLVLLAQTMATVSSARTLQQVINEGTLRVGVALSTPWAIRGADRELTGFEVEVARRLADDMRVEAIVLIYGWDQLIPALESGEVDIVAGMTITPERALHVNFSQPYATGGISLATNLASTASVQQLEDLNNPDYKIAVVRDSVAVELASRILAKAELVLVDSAELAGSSLLAGEVDGYLEDEPVPSFLALENPSAIDVPIARPLLQTPAGFAVSKGDHDFVLFLNAWITSREADTWLPTTYNYWFKSLHWRNELDAERR